jgi:hypothetical protein
VGEAAEGSNLLACIAGKTNQIRKACIGMSSNRFNWLLIVIVFLLGACSSKNILATANADPTVIGSPVGVHTMVSEAAIPTNTPEPSPTSTIPPTATFTPKPVPTEKPTITSKTVAVIPACTNRATLVRHLSFSDGSSISSGFIFGKAWRIQNTGTCTWTTAYALVFASGEQLNAPPETPLTREVPPGDTIDIQISMKAPDIANAYTSNWMLRDPEGGLFGTGEEANQPIGVIIVVKNPSTKDFHPFPECG